MFITNILSYVPFDKIMDSELIELESKLLKYLCEEEISASYQKNLKETTAF